MILGGHENLPSVGDFDKYQEACDDAEHVAARSALIAAGFDPDDPEIEDHMLEEIQACHAQAWERQDPDSGYHKYASPYARELRAERKQPVRARLRGPRRLDRRLSGGRPRTRRSSTSTRSTSRGDPDLDEPPRPARRAPGVFGWARA